MNTDNDTGETITRYDAAVEVAGWVARCVREGVSTAEAARYALADRDRMSKVVDHASAPDAAPDAAHPGLPRWAASEIKGALAQAPDRTDEPDVLVSLRRHYRRMSATGGPVYWRCGRCWDGREAAENPVGLLVCGRCGR